MTELLKGKPVADAIIKQVKETIREHSLEPALAIVRVGDRADDLSYERSIVKLAKKTGVATSGFSCEEDIYEESFHERIKSLNRDPDIHGILILQPLPPQIHQTKIREILLPEKDVDGITDRSLAGVFMNQNLGFAPCTAQACIEMLHYYGIPLKDKKVTVLGRSLTVGKAVAVMALAEHATVTICHSKTCREDLLESCRQADILISAAGKAGIIEEKHTRPGQVIIDVGVDLDGDGNLCGDADFAAVSKLAGKITPVPGGIGVVTTAVLLKHTAEAAKRLTGDKSQISDGRRKG